MRQEDYNYVSVTVLPVSTGFRAPNGTDIAHLKRITMRRCPACGEEHVWNGEDGYWEEEVPAPSFWEKLLIARRKLKRA